MPRKQPKPREQPKPTTDLDKYDEDTTDIELQNRGMLANPDGTVRMILYAWLSEARKKQNRENSTWGWRYCPFEEGEKVSKTCRELKLMGRIAALDRDYYDGDCLVLYVNLDKRSSKKWLDRLTAQAKTQAA